MPAFYDVSPRRDIYPDQGRIEHASNVAFCLQHFGDDAILNPRIGSHCRSYHLTTIKPDAPGAPLYGVALFAPVPAPEAPPPGELPCTPQVPLFWEPPIGAPPPSPLDSAVLLARQIR